MPEILDNYYEELLKIVPTGPLDDAHFLFSKETIGPPPQISSTSDLIVTSVANEYSASFRPDLLCFTLEHKTARSFGCLIVSTLLHGPKEPTRLQLTNAKSSARTIVIEFSHPDPETAYPGLSTVPLLGSYYPNDPPKHPWVNVISPFELPWFEFTNEQRVVLSDAQRAARDIVVVAGRAEGLWLLAELLLNAGRPDCSRDRFDLEGEAGFRGVAPRSAEISLNLPGSDHYDIYFNG